MSVGALPSERVQALLNKHLQKAEEAAKAPAAEPAQS
jgi:ribosomal protein S16